MYQIRNLSDVLPENKKNFPKFCASVLTDSLYDPFVFECPIRNIHVALARYYCHENTEIAKYAIIYDLIRVWQQTRAKESTKEDIKALFNYLGMEPWDKNIYAILESFDISIEFAKEPNEFILKSCQTLGAELVLSKIAEEIIRRVYEC